MNIQNIVDLLETSPVIAATDGSGWQQAVDSDSKILFHLKANILTIAEEIKTAKQKGKIVFVHMDLAEGIGKDKAGIVWLTNLGIDGIISTKSQLIRSARECGVFAIQRFFVLDSKGMHSIKDTLDASCPDFIEIMPGVIPKAIRLFENENIPVIAGGLIETKQEVIDALSNGAIAVSTGNKKLWTDI